MLKAILGRKIGMSQIFSPSGEVVPVTLVQAMPNQVTLTRQTDRDGYEAAQLGLVKANAKNGFAKKKEFLGRFENDSTSVSVSQFIAGDIVEVAGISKGKGFAGVVKRHHFKGGPASHGHRHVLRRPGSIGSRFPQHVFKGVRMAGRMGSDRVTVKNLTVAVVDVDNNVLAIKGALPGRRGTVLEIKAMNS